MLTLKVLRQFCGPQFFKNVVIATTMWDTFPPDVDLLKFQTRQIELAEEVGWKDMTQGGTKTLSYRGTSESAWNVLDTLLEGRVEQATPQIQDEMFHHIRLEETGAGRVLVEDMKRRSEKLEKEYQEELAEVERENRKKEDELRNMKADMEEARLLAESRQLHHQGQSHGQDRHSGKPHKRQSSTLEYKGQQVTRREMEVIWREKDARLKEKDAKYREEYVSARRQLSEWKKQALKMLGYR